jgi:hypothetical protein
VGRRHVNPIPTTTTVIQYPKPGYQRVGKAVSRSVARKEVQKVKVAQKGADGLL